MPYELAHLEELEDDLDGIAERIEQFLRDYATLQDDKSQPVLASIHSRIDTASELVREAIFLL